LGEFRLRRKSGLRLATLEITSTAAARTSNDAEYLSPSIGVQRRAAPPPSVRIGSFNADEMSLAGRRTSTPLPHPSARRGGTHASKGRSPSWRRSRAYPADTGSRLPPK